MHALLLLQCLPILASLAFSFPQQPTLGDAPEIYREGNPVVLDPARNYVTLNSKADGQPFFLARHPPYLPQLDDQDDEDMIDDDAGDVDKRRLRFNKRRLRFNKRRLRFNKRRLRFVKKDAADDDAFEQSSADTIEMPRERRRLRFVMKRAAESGMAATADERSEGQGQGHELHSRRRRSVDDDLGAEERHDLSKRVDLSINNALRLLTDMLIVKLQKKRQRELAEMRQRMLEAGKRSDNTAAADKADAAAIAVSENPDEMEVVKRLRALLV